MSAVPPRRDEGPALPFDASPPATTSPETSLLRPGDALYPERLRRLDDPPGALFVRGLAATLSARAVAIVGSRAPSTHARDVARALARTLARAGLVVVSGMARGIDAAAHRGALDANGLTVAVLGHGIDLVYPPDHRRLAGEIAAHGALLSELPPGAPPRAHHFPRRNRLVTGLAEALVVVEARERSGTLSSAAHALVQGRDVFVVPGPIGVAACAGSNRLLREGALVLLDATDVLLRLGLSPAPERGRASQAMVHDDASGGAGRAHGRGPGAREPQRSGHGVALSGNGLAKRVLEALETGSLSRDALARGLQCADGALSLALLELELAGEIAEERDGRLARRRF